MLKKKFQNLAIVSRVLTKDGVGDGWLRGIAALERLGDGLAFVVVHYQNAVNSRLKILMKATFGAASVKVIKSSIEFDLVVLVESLQLLQNAHVSDLVVPELCSKPQITKLLLSQHQLLPISSPPPCT
jgi:hypothetical protein